MLGINMGLSVNRHPKTSFAAKSDAEIHRQNRRKFIEGLGTGRIYDNPTLIERDRAVEKLITPKERAYNFDPQRKHRAEGNIDTFGYPDYPKWEDVKSALGDRKIPVGSEEERQRRRDDLFDVLKHNDIKEEGLSPVQLMKNVSSVFEVVEPK